MLLANLATRPTGIGLSLSSSSDELLPMRLPGIGKVPRFADYSPLVALIRLFLGSGAQNDLSGFVDLASEYIAQLSLYETPSIPLGL